MLAGKLFSLVALLGIAVATFLIVFLLFRRGAQAFRGPLLWVVVAMLGMTLAGHFGIQPIMAQLKAEALPREVMQSVLRDRFATWHGISSVPLPGAERLRPDPGADPGPRPASAVAHCATARGNGG